MKIELRPELEAMIKQNLERGTYNSADEFVAEAVSLLHEQQAWLADHGSEIRTKIEEGFAAARHGELIDATGVRSRLEGKKRTWLADKRQG